MAEPRSRAGYLPIEAQVLMHTVDARSDDDALRALVAEVDLSALFALATEEKAVDPVWRRIGALLGARRSEPAALAMHRAALVSQFRMSCLRQRVMETLAVLRREEIPALLLKGAALAMAVYPTFEDRPMGDVDVLVPRADAARGWAALRASGWRTVEEPEDRYDRHHHLPMLFDSSGLNIPLEVHTDLMPDEHPFRYGADDVRVRAVPLSGADDVRLPHPIDQLLHCAIHFVWSHEARTGGWRALRDVAAIVDRGVDWDAFTEAATRARAGTCAYWTLRLAASLASVPVPAPVLATLRPRRAEWQLRALERNFALQLFGGERRCPSVRLLKWLWEAAVEPVASGHGAARPWMWDERFVDGPPTARPTVAARLGGQARRAAEWGSYVGALLLPRRAS